jgi:hypothetical protein
MFLTKCARSAGADSRRHALEKVAEHTRQVLGL